MLIKAQIKFTKQQIEQLDELRRTDRRNAAQSWSAVQSTTTYAEVREHGVQQALLLVTVLATLDGGSLETYVGRAVYRLPRTSKKQK